MLCRPVTRQLLAAAAVTTLVACGAPAAESGDPETGAATSTTSSTPLTSAASPSPRTTTPTTTTTERRPPSTTTTRRAPERGPVVVLDPGHNGGNSAHPDQINRQVPAGRGRVKACNTTGTATGGGYPEHAFAWDVATRVRKILRVHGVKVVLTRQNDSGVGPCVNERAAIGNRAGADAVVSIHADGSTSPGARGFHIAYSAPPLNAAQRGPAVRLARAMRDEMRAAGLSTANYIGSAGLSPRDDLAGMNLSTRPAVLVECGNMRNPAEAAAFAKPGGRQRYAEVIAGGILAYLR